MVVGGRRYRCSGEETSEEMRDKAVNLLSETIKRMVYWRVWDRWWVELLADEWLELRNNIEVQLRGGRYDVDDVLKLVDEFIGRIEGLWSHWSEVGNEVRIMINDLLSGRSEVIIWSNGNGVSMYGRNITLSADITSTGGVTVHLSPVILEGAKINVPDVITLIGEEDRKRFVKILEALKAGFAESDEGKERSKPVMKTTQSWQAIAWALLYPGDAYVLVDSINVNESKVTIAWHLKALSHKSIKGAIFKDIEKLVEEQLLAFFTTVILGDGSAIISKNTVYGQTYDKPIIEVVMSGERFKLWRPLLEKLRKLGFTWSKSDLRGNAVVVRFSNSYAVRLARAMINNLPTMIRDLLDTLNIEKWAMIKQIAEMEQKFTKGEMTITLAGYRFTIVIDEYTVKLQHNAKDDAKVKEICEVLKRVYGDDLIINVRRWGGKYLRIEIPMYEIERRDSIKDPVFQVLCRKYQRVKLKDKKKEKKIIRL